MILATDKLQPFHVRKVEFEFWGFCSRKLNKPYLFKEVILRPEIYNFFSFDPAVTQRWPLHLHGAGQTCPRWTGVKREAHLCSQTRAHTMWGHLFINMTPDAFPAASGVAALPPPTQNDHSSGPTRRVVALLDALPAGRAVSWVS